MPMEICTNTTTMQKIWRVFRQERLYECLRQAIWRTFVWIISYPISVIFKGSTRLIREDLRASLVDIMNTRKVVYHIRSLRNNGMARSLEDINIRALKSSEKIFLLGSGASVNDLTSEDWAHISQHDSIGWNSWHIHDFVPTYYFFEMGDHGNRYYHFVRLLKEKEEEYASVPFICRFKNLYNVPNPFVDLPKKVRNNLYLSAPYFIKGRMSSLISQQLLIWRKLMFNKPQKNLGAIIHLRGTLSDVMSFSVLAGYKEIVLVGIDMNNKRYFWEEDPEKYPHGKGVRNVEIGDVHNTINPMYTNLTQTIPLDDVLDLFDRIVLKPNGIKLWIATRKSKLFPRFPLYPEFYEESYL